MPQEIKWTNGKTANVMTRRETINAWVGTAKTENLDSPCCPNCRDLLYKNEAGFYYCDNIFCLMPNENGGGGEL